MTQALTLLPVVARPGKSREEIIEAARPPGSAADAFEKDGFVWVGSIGLKFDAQGQLVEAKRAWGPE